MEFTRQSDDRGTVAVFPGLRFLLHVLSQFLDMGGCCDLAQDRRNRWFDQAPRKENLACLINRRASDERAAIRDQRDKLFMCKAGKHRANQGAAHAGNFNQSLLDQLRARLETMLKNPLLDLLIKLLDAQWAALASDRGGTGIDLCARARLPR